MMKPGLYRIREKNREFNKFVGFRLRDGWYATVISRERRAQLAHALHFGATEKSTSGHGKARSAERGLGREADGIERRDVPGRDRQ
jgi:hypothetical protein